MLTHLSSTAKSKLDELLIVNGELLIINEG